MHLGVIVFSGKLKMGKRTAKNLAMLEGFQVKETITRKTTILVVGIQKRKVSNNGVRNKHNKAKELISAGSAIRILNENGFINMLKQSS